MYSTGLAQFCLFLFIMTEMRFETNGKKQTQRTDETRLIEAIMNDYNPAARPVYNASDIVTVKFGITLTQISDMDEVNQVLTLNVWLEQEWTDERLVWNAEGYNNLSLLRIPCELLWLPDIVLYNSADDFTNGYMNSKAMVQNDGNVFWAPPAKFRCSCKIDITYFPFDDQKCELKFGSWTYDGFQVDITNRSSDVDLQNFVYSGEWELIYVGIRRTEVTYACCPQPFPDVRFTIVIGRKTLYYLFNIIFPCLWLTILSLLGFWLPPDSGEKITLGITVLLAFSVFMLLIAESMPATSEFVPLIGIYLTVTMGMTSLSIILTVFVLQLHHVGPQKKSVPRWLRTLVFDVLARAVCMRYNSSDKVQTNRQDVSKVADCDAVSCQGSKHVGGNWMNSMNGPLNNSVQYTFQKCNGYIKKCQGPPFPVQFQKKQPSYPEPCGNQRGINLQRPPQIAAFQTVHNEKLCPKTADNDYEILTPYGGRACENEQRILGQPLLAPASGNNHNFRMNAMRKTRRPLASPYSVYPAMDTSQDIGSMMLPWKHNPDLELETEWQFVAHVMDRVLFWLFLIVATVSSLAILVIKPLVKPEITWVE